MIRYLSREHLLDLHRLIIARSGGAHGLRDTDGLDSALAQPQMTFDGCELYPTIAAKAAALAFSLIGNHPFLDGNKRIGHAAMEMFLLFNGWEICAEIDHQENVILQVAAGHSQRETFSAWVEQHIVPKA